MVKLFSKYLIPACLFLLIIPATVLAFPKFEITPKGGTDLEQGQIRWGRVQFHPGFAFETRYEDNVFRQANKTFADNSFESKAEDFIFSSKPSLGIELQRGAGEVFGFYFDYRGENVRYLDLTTLDAFNHDISGGVNFGGPGGRGDITIGGRYDKSNSLRGRTQGDLQGNLAGGGVGTQISNNTAEGFVDVIYSLSRIFKLKFRADMEAEDFGGTSSIQNVDTYNIGGSFFWQATPLVAYGVKYNRRIRDYETTSARNDNSDSDQFYLAMKWNPSKLIESEVAVGFDTKRFENFSGEDRETLVFQIYTKYTPTKRTSVYVRANREIVDSSFRTIQAYIGTSLKLRLVQRLGKKFRTDIGGSFRNLDYGRSVADAQDLGAVKTRVDNAFTGTVALIYEIQKWLDAKVRYEYEQNMSNFDSRDYKGNMALIEVSAKY